MPRFAAILNARIASGEFQTVERAHMPGRQFTTAKTIAAEHEIVSRVREGRNQVEPVLSRSQAIAVADQHQHLNRTQRSVVEDVLSSPDRIQGIQGFAGSGKTTTLSVIRSAAEIQGFQVEGFAPTSRAARQLGEAGVEAGTLQGFLARSTAPTASRAEAFLLCGRIESCEHQPDARVSLPSRSSGSCVVDRRHAPASGRRSRPTVRAVAGGRNAHGQARSDRPSEGPGTQVRRRNACDRSGLRRAGRSAETGPRQGNSRYRRAHSRDCQELRRVARKDADRFAGQCLPARAECRRPAGIESQRHACVRRITASVCSSSARK